MYTYATHKTWLRAPHQNSCSPPPYERDHGQVPCVGHQGLALAGEAGPDEGQGAAVAHLRHLGDGVRLDVEGALCAEGGGFFLARKVGRDIENPTPSLPPWGANLAFQGPLEMGGEGGNW